MLRGGDLWNWLVHSTFRCWHWGLLKCSILDRRRKHKIRRGPPIVSSTLKNKNVFCYFCFSFLIQLSSIKPRLNIFAEIQVIKILDFQERDFNASLISEMGLPISGDAMVDCFFLVFQGKRLTKILLYKGWVEKRKCDCWRTLLKRNKVSFFCKSGWKMLPSVPWILKSILFSDHKIQMFNDVRKWRKSEAMKGGDMISVMRVKTCHGIKVVWDDGINMKRDACEHFN